MYLFLGSLKLERLNGNLGVRRTSKVFEIPKRAMIGPLIESKAFLGRIQTGMKPPNVLGYFKFQVYFHPGILTIKINAQHTDY